MPLHFRDEVRAGLETDVKKGVLERVPMSEPETWRARMVIQPQQIRKSKKDSGPVGFQQGWET